MKLPDNYSDLYPNRFLHADQLKGRKVTVTIKAIEIEVLEGEKGKQSKVIMHFVESPKQYVVPKTNGFCMKRMFGNNPNDWAGKLITIFPTTTKFGRDTVDCIRIWGSPHLESDMSITVPAGRKKPYEMVMHKVRSGECGFKGEAVLVKQEIETPPEPIFEPEAESIAIESLASDFFAGDAFEGDLVP